MPGVQVLFAFLLAVAFQQRFAEVTDLQRHVYFDGALVVVTVAATSALFIGLWFVLGLVRRSSEERSAS